MVQAVLLKDIIPLCAKTGYNVLEVLE